MAEYIERKLPDKELTAAAVNDKDKNRRTWAKAICVLHDLPAADVAPVVYGRWEWIGPYRYNDDGMIGTCSVCKERLRLFAYNYCPNCGARMDGGRDDKAD